MAELAADGYQLEPAKFSLYYEFIQPKPDFSLIIFAPFGVPEAFYTWICGAAVTFLPVAAALATPWF